jgi:hypothetical protein
MCFNFQLLITFEKDRVKCMLEPTKNTDTRHAHVRGAKQWTKKGEEERGEQGEMRGGHTNHAKWHKQQQQRAEMHTAVKKCNFSFPVFVGGSAPHRQRRGVSARMPAPRSVE